MFSGCLLAPCWAQCQNGQQMQRIRLSWVCSLGVFTAGMHARVESAGCMRAQRVVQAVPGGGPGRGGDAGVARARLRRVRPRRPAPGRARLRCMPAQTLNHKPKLKPYWSTSWQGSARRWGCDHNSPGPRTESSWETLNPKCARAAGGGVWGSARWEADSPSARAGPEVSDEDLQAQAWLPSCLTALLAEVRPCSSPPQP